VALVRRALRKGPPTPGWPTWTSAATPSCPSSAEAYGPDQAALWCQRWRLFFLAVAETFAYDQGETWWVATICSSGMVALWANFAATLNVSLGALRARPWLAALLGGLGGPLAYWGGAGLGAMRLVEPLPALLVLAAGWAALTPLLFRLATWLEARPWR
jgi:hypothetical protein